MLEINLPEEVKELVEGSIFDIEEKTDNDKLSKFLFYAPDLIKIYGLAIAELKRQKRGLEKKVLKAEYSLEIATSEILLDLDTSAYKNEALRSAKLATTPEIGDARLSIRNMKDEILDIDSDIDELYETYWKWKNLRESLGDISKIRVAEMRV